MSYTDPFCSWCWAAEPVLLRLRETFRGQVAFRTVMGGLVQEARGLLAPASGQRAWLESHLVELSQRTGQPIDEGLLGALSGERFSSWPACIHVKAAFAQGAAVGERYLRRLRRAVMTERCNASDPEAAVALAREVEGLDEVAFRSALADGSALADFHADRLACREQGVSGFPTFVVRMGSHVPVGPAPLRLTGYRSFGQLRGALQRIAPGLWPRPPRGPEALLDAYGPLTTRELGEIRGRSVRHMGEQLAALEEGGRVRRLAVRRGDLWYLQR